MEGSKQRSSDSQQTDEWSKFSQEFLEKRINCKRIWIEWKVFRYSLLPLVIYLIDIALDCNLIVNYWMEGNERLFPLILTSIFVFLGTIGQSVLGVYYDYFTPVKRESWSYLMFISLLFGPLVRYEFIIQLSSKNSHSFLRFVNIWQDCYRCKLLMRQCKFPEALEHYKSMLNNVAMSKYLGLIEFFVESAPQAILQLYILYTGSDSVWSSKFITFSII